MDQIPSFVIRGICNVYCDSHKYKEWQLYAALVASIHAKIFTSKDSFTQPERRHWLVPFRKTPGFVGRGEEIIKIEEWFGKVNGPSKGAICGLGGIGNTQLALELAYPVHERDTTCSVFWIPCTSYASIEQAYMGVAHVIGIQEVNPADAKERVKAHFRHVNGGKWFLIFDNADEMDLWFGGTTEMAKLLPQSEQGHILSTTRNRRLAVRLVSPFVVGVSEPDAETSVKILEKELLRKNLLQDRNKTTAFLEQLMFLPLTISQAAAYINANGIRLSDYSALLKEQEPDVIDLLSEDFGDDGRYHEIQNAIATTWLIIPADSAVESIGSGLFIIYGMHQFP